MAILTRLKLGRYPVPLVDTPDTELGRKAAENPKYFTRDDRPVDGATPLDGEGNPMTSQIQLRDEQVKLAQGFTSEPVVPKAKTVAKKR